MYTSYPSNTSAGVDNYPYITNSSDDHVAGTSVSQNVLCNGGEWISADPITYQSHEASNITQFMSHKPTRKDLEEEIAAVRAQCNEKKKNIAFLKDKLSELENNGRGRESELEQQLEETLQQLTNVKKAAFVANGHFLKKKQEFEELKKELQNATEREIETNKQTLCLKNEVKVLQERLAKMIEDNSKKIGSRGEPISSTESKPSAIIAEHFLVSESRDRADRLKQCQKNGNVELRNESESVDKKNHIETKFPLFRAEDYFDPQPSEFDFLTNIVVENYPVRASSLAGANHDKYYQKEITKVNPPTISASDVQEPKSNPVAYLSANEVDQVPKPKKVYSPFSIRSAKAKGRLNLRPLPTSGVIRDDNLMKPLPINGAAIYATEIWNPYANTTNNKAKGRLNPRPLPTSGVIRDDNLMKPLPINGTAISATEIWNPYANPTNNKAASYLNHRPLPANSGIGTYRAPMTTKEKQTGYFGRTLTKWFGF